MICNTVKFICAGICLMSVLSSGCKHGEKTMTKNLQNGAVIFTFDDCDVDGWTGSIALFRRYNAHATFFFCGNLGEKELACMKKLSDAGHSVGLHTQSHADAPQFIQQHGKEAYYKTEIAPQLEAVSSAGIDVRNFAFPNNRKDDASISLLKQHFRKFRAGCGASLTAPGSEAYENAFFPVAELPQKEVFGGFGVGEYYKTELPQLLAALEKASRENKVLVIFSHAIAPQAKSVNMPLEYLTAALEKADSLGMAILGFDDIQPGTGIEIPAKQ